jgi:hypothetical protein
MMGVLGLLLRGLCVGLGGLQGHKGRGTEETCQSRGTTRRSMHRATRRYCTWRGEVPGVNGWGSTHRRLQLQLPV